MIGRVQQGVGTLDGFTLLLDLSQLPLQPLEDWNEGRVLDDQLRHPTQSRDDPRLHGLSRTDRWRASDGLWAIKRELLQAKDLRSRKRGAKGEG